MGTITTLLSKSLCWAGALKFGSRSSAGKFFCWAWAANDNRAKTTKTQGSFLMTSLHLIQLGIGRTAGWLKSKSWIPTEAKAGLRLLPKLRRQTCALLHSEPRRSYSEAEKADRTSFFVGCSTAAMQQRA